MARVDLVTRATDVDLGHSCTQLKIVRVFDFWLAGNADKERGACVVVVVVVVVIGHGGESR